MGDDVTTRNSVQAGRRYTWPWFVLAAVVLGIVLAIVWMSHEVQRTKRNRETNPASPQMIK
jgi:hypothetical protein